MNKPAPELHVSQWLNAPAAVRLPELQGRVVAIEAFQMLCPGCVSHGLPQAKRIAETFSREQVVVLGLHTVFEHHAVQGTPEALAAFLHENRITFPVGIDERSNAGPVPKTMQSYALQGTPTLILVDKKGGIAHQIFGSVQDMALGAQIEALILE